MSRTPTPPSTPTTVIQAPTAVVPPSERSAFLVRRRNSFPTPSIFRRKKRAKVDAKKDTATSSYRPLPNGGHQDPPAKSGVWTELTPKKARSEGTDTDSEDTWETVLSSNPVDSPPLGLFSKLPWRVFGQILNELDCTTLEKFSSCGMHHAVAVSTAMGLQGVEYCFGGCHRCHRSPRAIRRSGLAY
eukprot:jgi/Mesvir1/18632/Mv17141-RA.1